ncbi:MAG TPA: FAD-dependent oxidoreductase [Xanthobacteraceae bacterium]|nr:FAD-dependent oxidoreductase [Xanthobacteraceae bacterium]
MPQSERCENLILGSGTSGKSLAWHLAQSGQRTAVVERQWIGGACPNVACLPSKNEIRSAEVAHLAHQAAQFGVITGPITTNMEIVRQRKRDMVNRDVDVHLQIYKSTGAELVMGTGRFVAPKTIEVRLNDAAPRVLYGDRVFLNLGTHPAVPAVPGLASAGALTHIEALELDYLPQHLLVLGGGYVGLEMAQAYRRFGSGITVIEPGSQLMSREDPDVANEMQRILSEEGIQFFISTEALNVDGRSGEKVSVNVRTRSSGDTIINGSDILVAAGRIPNTAGIGLKEVGVELDAHGYIRVNERLETTATDVWAMGDCAGSPQFTHVARDDFRIVRDNLAGQKRSTHDRLVPYCMFTDPPLAHVGLNERTAQHDGVLVRIAKLPMSAVLRTAATGETQGFMKALVGADDDLILGFTMIGAEAGEVMAAVQTAMMAKLPYQKLRDAVLTHPTMAEGLGPLFENVPPRSASAGLPTPLAAIA